MYLPPLPQKSLSSTGLSKQQGNNQKKAPVENKKNKAAKSTGILVNKNEQPAGKANQQQQQVTDNANHFDVIHPKDDVEMLRAQVSYLNYLEKCKYLPIFVNFIVQKDEPNKGGKPQKNAANELRKEKKGECNVLIFLEFNLFEIYSETWM